MMRTDVLQRRMQSGDNEAFAELCRVVVPGLYRTLRDRFPDEAAARAAVKRVLLLLRAEMHAADEPVDVNARLAALIAAAAPVGETAAAIAPEEKLSVPKTAAPARADEAWIEEPIAAEARDEIRYDGRRYQSRRRGYVLEIALAVLFAMLFFWLLFGTLMHGGAIPFVDLGYTWFNEHVFELFYSIL